MNSLPLSLTGRAMAIVAYAKARMEINVSLILRLAVLERVLLLDVVLLISGLKVTFAVKVTLCWRGGRCREELS